MSDGKLLLLVDLSSDQRNERLVQKTYGSNQVDVEVIQAEGVLKFFVSCLRASLAINFEGLEKIR